LNHVKKLGWFVEVEYLSNIKDMKIVAKEVHSVIERLGINKKDIVKEGYTKLLWNKK
jgi:predicted adenylyl cyclase CyaB